MSGLDSLVIDINPNDTGKSTTFGSGIELLMNDKKKNNSMSNISEDLKLGELSELETELNNLSDNIKDKSIESSFGKKIENTKTNNIMDNLSESFNVKFEDKNNEPNIAVKTVDALNESKTWDGYGKFNKIPIENEQIFTKEELLKEKFRYLKKLEDLESKGATLTKKYNMESSLTEMQGEYEMLIDEKEKSNSVKFQGRMLMAAITGLEFLNNKFDPFDLKMDGWGEQVNENISDYDEIFAELHEKYKSKAKMAPELKLLFQLGGSAIMVHMTNTMFKSTIPGMDDILKQNPELMQQFSQAAASSMSNNNPGFGSFMSNFMPGGNNNDYGTPPPVSNMGSLPPAMNTQVNKSERYAPPQNRPDMMASKNPGINVQEKFSNINETNTRPNMKGPSDISDLLSGLKPLEKKVEKESSTISIQDLKELSNEKIPKSNKKGKQSRERNTISLDL